MFEIAKRKTALAYYFVTIYLDYNCDEYVNPDKGVSNKAIDSKLLNFYLN